jgi:hypothetical protein
MCRWKDSIKTDVKEIGCENVDWNHLVHDRDQWRAFVNTTNEPSDFIKGGEFLD